MQAVRAGIRALGSSSSLAPMIKGARVFSQSAPLAYSPSAFLEKQEVTFRVLDLLRSTPFIDPAKVTQTASFKDDLQLDILDNNQVIIAAEEEFAVDIPENEANKISTTAHLIDYLTAHPQAK
ncbi:uncharacterized protein LOC132161774 [Corylus avellana]|uniref:uncharacterized protein LOC132161774 n=1 Tax=Corylus avellana TaxID=13451 RepID=UPI001E238930|nr:uncharacterized protein LOC132161774 [Corylus avellana]